MSLTHGAWEDGSSWAKVILLKKQGPSLADTIAAKPARSLDRGQRHARGFFGLFP